VLYHLHGVGAEKVSSHSENTTVRCFFRNSVASHNA